MASLSCPVSLHHRHVTPRRIQITCGAGARGNRPPLHCGRVLSSESILAIQSLKRLSLSTNPDRPFPTSTFSRLLKPDLVAIISELNRQKQPHLALMVFSFLRTDPSYKTDLSLYAALISSFGESRSEDAGMKVDELVSDLLKEKSDGFKQEERMKVTRVVRALVKARRGEAVKRVYQEMKRCGFEADEYLFRVLVRGLERLGEKEVAKEAENDFKEWWYQGSDRGKLEGGLKVLDEMPQRDGKLQEI
ncbi:Pentatricopeptide repeat-containing protein [Rhynchospora pubera]|uniref:Pentatricopeptide repeat-containing protein n=1 Tax=Rhynchospora pubera TaxID=906938 RepID=A0AAV8HAX7_9POAL|nr:Pentatricopeptide repeat-containing protein [Rhynchospora pubera]